MNEVKNPILRQCCLLGVSILSWKQGTFLSPERGNMIIFLILYGTNEALRIFSESYLVRKGPVSTLSAFSPLRKLKGHSWLLWTFFFRNHFVWSKWSCLWILRVLMGQEVPCLHGVSILSFKEAKGTFLTPVRENMNLFLHKSFFMVQIKLYVKFQISSLSGSAPSPWCLHSFL